MKITDHITWKIVEIREEAPRVKTLVLEAENERPNFVAGQYLTVQLPNFEPTEGKSYSISSPPHGEHVCLTIKEMGAFSKALLSHTIDDTLTTSLPYGFFYPDPGEVRDVACVVGGIGITPCMSIIESLIQSNFEKNIFLFYSNKTVEDIIFKKRLDALKEVFPKLTITHFITEVITKETEMEEPMRTGRMTADRILPTLKDQNDTDFFICGSIDFTKSLWKSLRDAGIESSQIYTEGFF